MSTQLIKPPSSPGFEIRCNAADAIVANLAAHVVFFFERHLDVAALKHAFARALESFPVIAGRMALSGGAMRIRCDGGGVPFTASSSDRTLSDAIRSVSRDSGAWLVDPVNGVVSRWGWGPICTVRVTHLADDATAIGFSWHHVIGDMQTLMHFMNAWADSAAGRTPSAPLIVADRAAYLEAHLPPGGTREPGVRCLRPSELARSAVFLAKDAHRQRTLSVYFADGEIARMREAYRSASARSSDSPGRSAPARRLSANDVLCEHICNALMAADPTMDGRALAIIVNVRTRCGLDPMLVGNMITTLKLDLRREDPAGAMAERIRDAVDHFADEYCDIRTNQSFLDAAGPWRRARCVSTAFNPSRWNPLITNWSGFGVYRIRFEGAYTTYFTPMMKFPVTGLGALVEGVEGRGLIFRMTMPPKMFEAASGPSVQQRLRRFRCEDDDVPALQRLLDG